MKKIRKIALFIAVFVAVSCGLALCQGAWAAGNETAEITRADGMSDQHYDTLVNDIAYGSETKCEFITPCYAYNINKDGEVILNYILDPEIEKGVLTVPSTIDGKKVKSLDKNAFYAVRYSSLYDKTKKIIISEGIENIGCRMLFNFEKLEEVVLPSTLKMIPPKAFFSCDKLKRVEIAEGTETIGFEAFKFCSALESADLPESLKTIGYAAFKNCGILGGKVYLGKNVSNIGWEAFSYCRGLTGFRVSAENEHFSQKGGVLFNKDKTTLICCLPSKNTKSYTVPKTVEMIEPCAFVGNKRIKEIRFGKNLKTIRNDAFKYSGLEKINFSEGLESIGDYAFKFCKKLKKIILPEGLKYCLVAFDYCYGLEELSLPTSVDYIYIDELYLAENFKKLTVKNPLCEIHAYYNDLRDYHIKRWADSKLVIYGYKNSPAEKIAKDLNLKFSSLGVNRTVMNLKEKASSTEKIDLGWDKVPGASYYQVYCRPSKGNWKWALTTKDNFASVKGLESATKYYFRVRAVFGKEKADYSYRIEIRTKLPIPDSISVVREANKIVISWEPVPGATKYEIITSPTSYGTKKRYIDTTQETTYTVDVAEDEKPLYYAVRAYKYIIDEDIGVTRERFGSDISPFIFPQTVSPEK